MKLALLIRSGVMLLLLCVIVCLPAGCGGQKKEEPGNPKVENKKEKPVDPLAEAKKRSRENLYKIGQAMHTYHDARKTLPVGILDPKTGKLGLSWRVAILGFLDDPQAMALYKKFKQDEPWDSDHNKKLLAEMPRVYAPVQGQAPEGHTFYQGIATHFVEEDGKELAETAKLYQMNHPLLFPDPRTIFGSKGKASPDVGQHAPGKRFTDCLDGTSNTILVVEAATPVPWTKPQDVSYPVNVKNRVLEPKYLPKLGGMFGGDFHVLIADGSSNHYARKNVPPEKLFPYITPDAGDLLEPPGIFEQAPEEMNPLPNEGGPKNDKKN